MIINFYCQASDQTVLLIGTFRKTKLSEWKCLKANPIKV